MNLDRLLARRLPDPLLRSAVRLILKTKVRKQRFRNIEDHLQYMLDFVQELKKSSIAIHTDDVNVQHYELPPQFFKAVLGSRLKYSCGYWTEPVNPALFSEGLDHSEETMLELTCRRAGLADGDEVLDLGCGWGSGALYMAEKYQEARITAVSNSGPQIEYIKDEAARQGLKNLTAIKADINDLELPQNFDRVVTVEMFEHMRNYQALLAKVADFIRPGGSLFIHIFTHHSYPFLYETRSSRDWMARHFFSGGTMPSMDLLHYFLEHFSLEKQWALSGRHYRYTLEAWLQKMDCQREEIYPLFVETYGAERAEQWWNYWRLFFLSCAEFFGFNNGNEWFVSHYLLRKK